MSQKKCMWRAVACRVERDVEERLVRDRIGDHGCIGAAQFQKTAAVDLRRDPCLLRQAACSNVEFAQAAPTPASAYGIAQTAKRALAAPDHAKEVGFDVVHVEHDGNAGRLEDGNGVGEHHALDDRYVRPEPVCLRRYVVEGFGRKPQPRADDGVVEMPRIVFPDAGCLDRGDVFRWRARIRRPEADGIRRTEPRCVFGDVRVADVAAASRRPGAIHREIKNTHRRFGRSCAPR